MSRDARQALADLGDAVRRRAKRDAAALVEELTTLSYTGVEGRLAEKQLKALMEARWFDLASRSGASMVRAYDRDAGIGKRFGQALVESGELRRARDEMSGLLAHSVELAEQALAPDAGDTPLPPGLIGEDVVLAGQTRLMGVQDLADVERLRELFEAFARKREILQLLERTANAPGVRIFIGEETGLAPLEGMSLVTAPYAAGDRPLGVLGVIGPSRMAYDRVIPVVQAAAEALGAALRP